MNNVKITFSSDMTQFTLHLGEVASPILERVRVNFYLDELKIVAQGRYHGSNRYQDLPDFDMVPKHVLSLIWEGISQIMLLSSSFVDMQPSRLWGDFMYERDLI